MPLFDSFLIFQSTVLSFRGFSALNAAYPLRNWQILSNSAAFNKSATLADVIATELIEGVGGYARSQYRIGEPRLYSVNATTDTLTLTGGWQNWGVASGDTVFVFTTDNSTPPAPLETDIQYFARDVDSSAGTLRLVVGNVGCANGNRDGIGRDRTSSWQPLHNFACCVFN